MQKFYWILLILSTLAMAIVMRETGKTLVTEYTPAGIINLELARSKSNVINILHIWSIDNDGPNNRIQAARYNTYLDFIFIGCYVSLLYFLTLFASSKFYKRSLWARWGKSVMIMCLVAGGLDILENIGMLFSLHQKISSNMVLLTFSSSFLKWLLVGLIISYLLVSLILKQVIPEKKKPNHGTH